MTEAEHVANLLAELKHLDALISAIPPDASRIAGEEPGFELHARKAGILRYLATLPPGRVTAEGEAKAPEVVASLGEGLSPAWEPASAADWTAPEGEASGDA